MAVFVGCEAIVFLTVLCLSSLLHAEDPLSQSPDHPTETVEQAYDHAELADEIRRSGYGSIRFNKGVSARTETTPSVCSYAMNCEFHHYVNWNRENIVGVTKYCNCPEGSQCTYAGDNMKQRYLYYKCVNVTESTTQPMRKIRGETEQGSETQHSTGMKRTHEDGDPSRIGRSENVRSLPKLEKRVGKVDEL